MQPLDLNYINRLAPYKVWTNNWSDYYIETDQDNIYKVGFMDDYSIWETGAYQFTINNEKNQPSPNDIKLRDTFFRLLEAFFIANPDILLYICETGDNRQELRNRLFIRWYNNYPKRESYILKTAEVTEGDIRNFAALIVQKNNPRLSEIISDFDELINILNNKP